ncbi:hypothetical protein ACLRGF_12440 [Mycetocola zhadangensis]|uniref:hypothetical protein n=1 Tax=Mycetocola zhadangensis TaxID=1164595 RepID=UPI003A4E0C8C
MTEDLTASEFEAMTGLTTKALRLYGERGILSPVSVDPLTGYRSFDRSQGQHGILLDLLRRAYVPMAELPTARTFDFTQHRQALTMQRHLEDFFLDVAERVAEFDPSSFVAHSNAAPALEWVGVAFDLTIPDEFDDRVETIRALVVDAPRIEQAFEAALAELGEEPADRVWSTAPDSIRNRSAMVLARPASVRLSSQRARIETQVRSATGQNVAVVSGTLPRRLETTFISASSDELTPVDEAAAGYLHLLAFERYLAENELSAISAHGRQVVNSPSLFLGPAPVTVFDVHPR